MSVHITYFVHGTTTDNEQEISSGWAPVELSKLGLEQSAKLKDMTQDRQFDIVFCSDFNRAHETANIAFNDRFEVIPDARLRECNYGTYNGKASAIVEPLQEQNTTNRFPEGESYDDVKARIADFLDFLKENYEGKHVAIVAHKAPQLALDVLLKGMTWEEAFANDWRKTRAWQAGWEYELK